MLRRLELENFTVFENATFVFSDHINVLHGVNGTGKSHVLKLAYVLQHAMASPPATTADPEQAHPSKAVLQRAFAEELVEVFRPDALGRLTTRIQGRTTSKVAARFDVKPQRTSFTFSTASKTEVRLDQVPERWVQKPPVFLPTREALTLYPGFVSLYDTHAIEFDRTWRDLCLLLGAPLSRGVKAKEVRALLEPIEEVMGAKVDLDKSGRFYLVDERGRIEMHLVAEGLRKLAMLARLVATGSLVGKGCLLWDEPETNLNPRLIVKVVEVLCALAAQGVQVFVATHSLFLMRELHIRVAKDPLKVRYFGLHRKEDGQVDVEQGDSIEDSGDIAALDENLAQSGRFMEIDP